MCEKNEEYSSLNQALTEYAMTRWREYEVPKDFDEKLSKRDRRKCNRWGREKIGLKNALYPEVDNVFERTRSKIARRLNEYREKTSK